MYEYDAALIENRHAARRTHKSLQSLVLVLPHQLGPFMPLLRSVTLLVVSAFSVCASASVSAQRTPVTTRYRYESKTVQAVDATGLGGDKQSSTLQRVGWLSVTLTDSAGGKIMRTVIDSVSTDAETRASIGSASIDSARGAKFTGFLASDGAVSNFTMPSGAGTLGALLGSTFDEFFPRVKAGYKSGDTWTIASEKPQVVSNGELVIKRSTSYTARGVQSYDGAPSNRIDFSFTTTSTGSQMVGPNKANVDGGSSGNGAWYMSTSGAFLGGTRSEQNDRKLMLTGAPAPLLVTARVTTTISVIK